VASAPSSHPIGSGSRLGPDADQPKASPQFLQAVAIPPTVVCNRPTGSARSEPHTNAIVIIMLSKLRPVLWTSQILTPLCDTTVQSSMFTNIPEELLPIFCTTNVEAPGLSKRRYLQF